MKTTILGILTIIAAVSGGAASVLKGGAIDIPSLIAAVTAGIGLIKAADSK